MAVCKVLSLLIVAVLFAATSFSCANALDPVLHDGSSGRKVLLESLERRVANIYSTSSFSVAVSAAQEERQRIADFTSGTFSEKPRNTPAPPAVGPAPGLFNLKPRNTPAPPAVGPAPGLFNLKPRNTPAPPAVGPAPGTETNWEVNKDQLGSITIDNALDQSVSVQCHSGPQGVPTTIIPRSAPVFTFSIQEDPTANIPWICDFSVLGVKATQSFPVWAHDGTPYLSDCDDCIWKVQNNGFWIWSPIQGTYINLHSWNL